MHRDQMKARKKGGRQLTTRGAPHGLMITAATVHLLALCVVILYQVLQQIHTLFGLDFINFNEILWK